MRARSFIEHELLLQKLLAVTAIEIQQIYESLIKSVSQYYYLAGSNNLHRIASFDITDVPLFEKIMEQMLDKFHEQVESKTVDAVKKAWSLSNNKNREWLYRGGVFDPNEKALKAFINRTQEGMNLSERIWDLKAYKFEIEAGLVNAINEGMSARQFASLLKKNLKQPDKLFRRIKKDGKMQLSRAAKAYNPGKGVYRSSFQNALRLTGSEINLSYRTADYLRWKDNPLLTGIKVQTSNNHPLYDICDAMAGDYPKDFFFPGWHPRCRCFATPITITNDELNEQEKVALGISTKKVKVSSLAKIPATAKAWIKKNAERIRGWKHTPYWVAKNPKYVEL